MQLNKTKPEEWKKKHVEELKKNMKSLPDIKNLPLPLPLPANYATFSKTFKLKEDKKIKAAPLFGKDDRFRIMKNDPNNTPGPAKYELMATWNGKVQSTKKSDKKELNWMNKVSTGISTSIYYS